MLLAKKIDSEQNVHKNIVFVGATRNFFKIGHTTIHRISNQYPRIKIRLAIPDIENAKPACKGANVEFIQWNPSADVSLTHVFQGYTSTLFVPPINNRIQVCERYLNAAKKAGIKYIVCIGIQHDNPKLRLSREAKTVENMLIDSGISHSVLNLPMFLENLLYQANSIKNTGKFYFPCQPDSKFSYVSCSDLALIVAPMLVTGAVYLNTQWTAETQTSCRELASIFSDILRKKIEFVQVTKKQFLEKLIKDGGSASSKHAALGILDLWKEIDAGRDLKPTKLFSKLLGKKPMTIEEWVKEHICCFTESQVCYHPQPPNKQTGI